MSSNVEEILLYHHSHLDVGFTQHPGTVWARQRDYLRMAMDLAEKYADGAEGERFKWTCESTAAVEDFLRHGSGSEIDRLARLCRAGLIEITAMFANITPLLTLPELIASLQPVIALRSSLGIPITTAVNHDVNGQSWMLPELFKALGVEFLMMGINKDLARPPLPRPRGFWWQGANGSKLLVWNGEHYGWGQYVGIPRAGWHSRPIDLELSRQHLTTYLAQLSDDAYPYDFAVLSVTNMVTWDNDSPNEELVAFVREWNRREWEPRLRLATPADIYTRLVNVAESPQDVPTQRGEWTDWWGYGVGSSARETALKGWASKVWEGATVMRAVSPVSMGAEDNRELDRGEREAVYNLLLYSEHTWGSSFSITDPDAIDSIGQWHTKGGYAYAAAAEAWRHWVLASRGLSQRVRGPEPAVMLFNPLPWPVMQRVIMPKLAETSGRGSVWPLHNWDLDLEVANPVSPVTVRDSVDYGLIELPAVGYRTLSLLPPESSFSPGLTVDRWSVANSMIRLKIDPQSGGIRSLVSQADHYEWCDQDHALKLAEYVYHRIDSVHGRRHLQPGNPPRDVRSDLTLWQAPGPRVIRQWTSHGPGLVTFSVELMAHAMKSLQVSYTLYQAVPWIDVSCAFTKEVTAPAIEALYLAFPFQLSDARLRYESGGAVVEAETDQLPIACRDFMSVQGWVDLSNAERGVTLALPDTPLVCWGDFPVGSYTKHAPVGSPLLLSWVMNNYWHANFRASQDGRLVTRYRIIPHGTPFDREAALQMGASFGLPLLASALTSGQAASFDDPIRDLPETQQLLEIEPNSAHLLKIQLVDHDDQGATWRLDLQPMKTVSEGTLRFPNFGPVTEGWRCSLDGKTMIETLPTTDGGAGVWNGSVGEVVSLLVRCRLLATERRSKTPS